MISRKRWYCVIHMHSIDLKPVILCFGTEMSYLGLIRGICYAAGFVTFSYSMLRIRGSCKTHSCERCMFPLRGEVIVWKFPVFERRHDRIWKRGDWGHENSSPLLSRDRPH